jgi:hypothetical protein
MGEWSSLYIFSNIPCFEKSSYNVINILYDIPYKKLFMNICTVTCIIMQYISLGFIQASSIFYSINLICLYIGGYVDEGKNFRISFYDSFKLTILEQIKFICLNGVSIILFSIVIAIILYPFVIYIWNKISLIWNKISLIWDKINGVNAMTCKICYENNVSKILPCGHVYCDDCSNKISKCSFCRAPFCRYTVKPVYLS